MKDMGPTRRSSAQLVQFVLRGDLLNVRPGRGLFAVINRPADAEAARRPG